jgi:putative membrane protein
MSVEGFDPTPEAERRTLLAGERTLLAWLRTGLTVIAVALAVGRIIPEVAGTQTAWPYAVVGVGYSILGIAMVGYGFYRGKRVDEAVRLGKWADMDPNFMRFTTGATILLALATAVLIIGGT